MCSYKIKPSGRKTRQSYFHNPCLVVVTVGYTVKCIMNGRSNISKFYTMFLSLPLSIIIIGMSVLLLCPLYFFLLSFILINWLFYAEIINIFVNYIYFKLLGLFIIYIQLKTNHGVRRFRRVLHLVMQGLSQNFYYTQFPST